jgi:fumarate reductase flavoprotein subunit
VVEADAVPSGSTALSAGLIPAAGTRFQREAGIEDDASLFAEDIQRKAKGENPQHLVDLLATTAGPTIEWLADRFGLPFSLVTDFDYPGHSRRRMHGLPTRSGSRTGRPSARGLRGDRDRYRLQPARHDALRGRRACDGGRGRRT